MLKIMFVRGIYFYVFLHIGFIMEDFSTFFLGKYLWCSVVCSNLNLEAWHLIGVQSMVIMLIQIDHGSNPDEELPMRGRKHTATRWLRLMELIVAIR